MSECKCSGWRFSCKCIVFVYRNRCLRNPRPQCQYSCGNGFYIDDVNDTKTCGLNGVWPSAPPCAEYQCPVLITLHQKNLLGQFVIKELPKLPLAIPCEEGWEINGTADVSCDFFGVWGPVLRVKKCLRISGRKWCGSSNWCYGRLREGFVTTKDTQDLSNLRTIKLEVIMIVKLVERSSFLYAPISVRISSFLCREITVSTSGHSGYTETQSPWVHGARLRPVVFERECENTISLLSKNLSNTNTQHSIHKPRISTPKYQVRSNDLPNGRYIFLC